MLNIEDSILVIIDIQEKLVLASKYGTEAAQNMTKLTKAAKILSIPTVVTEQYPKGLGSTLLQLSENFSPDALVTEKTAFSAMQEAEFSKRILELKKAGKKQVIIGGIETHICVLQTAIDLIKEGFDVYIAKDACASRNKSEYKTGLELLKQYEAKISCVEIILFQWLKSSRHPLFKEIQTLIK